MTPEEETKRDEEEMRKLEGQVYWHGQLPSKVAERLLKKDGDWLLRYNDKDAARGFVISVFWEEKAKHFKLSWNKTAERISVGGIKEKKKFESVAGLVEWFQEPGRRLGKEEGEGPALQWVVSRDWDLNPLEISRKEKVGEGSFGEVWRGTLNKRNQPPTDVAIKVLKDKDPEARQRFKNEGMFQLRFEHRHVVRTLGVVWSEEPLMIVMELMAKGSLDKYLWKNKRRLSGAAKRDGKPETGTLVGWLRDAARGCLYLETLKVIHRDLAARNCLVSDKEEVKISDFGLAKSVQSYKMTEGKVAWRWMAPETMRTGEYTIKSDVWSFGVLCWEVMSLGAEPWPKEPADKIKKRILELKNRLSAPPQTPKNLWYLVEDCWREEPQQRPPFATVLAGLNDLLEHPQQLKDFVNATTAPIGGNEGRATAPAGPVSLNITQQRLQHRKHSKPTTAGPSLRAPATARPNLKRQST